MVAHTVIVQNHTGHDNLAADLGSVLQEASRLVQAPEAGFQEPERPLDDLSGPRQGLIVVQLWLVLGCSNWGHEPRLDRVPSVPCIIQDGLRWSFHVASLKRDKLLTVHLLQTRDSGYTETTRQLSHRRDYV